MQVLTCIGLFKFNSESEILKGPDHSVSSVSGLPVTCVSYESESMDDDDTDTDSNSDLEACSIHVYLNQHLNDGCKTSSAELPNTDPLIMQT